MGGLNSYSLPSSNDGPLPATSVYQWKLSRKPGLPFTCESNGHFFFLLETTVLKIRLFHKRNRNLIKEIEDINKNQMATEGQKTTVTKISKPNGWISHNEWDRRNNY